MTVTLVYLSFRCDMLTCSNRHFLTIFNQENSKMFAGRQIHPFFSSWKVGKKFQDPVQSELSSCAVKRKDEEVITCAPIHVFENIEVCDLSIHC